MSAFPNDCDVQRVKLSTCSDDADMVQNRYATLSPPDSHVLPSFNRLQ